LSFSQIALNLNGNLAALPLAAHPSDPAVLRANFHHSRAASPNERCCRQRYGGTLCNCAVLRTTPLTADLWEPSQQSPSLCPPSRNQSTRTT
jgi:hypothetical protein